MTKLLNRSEVDENLTWNLKLLYETEEAYNKDITLIQDMADKMEASYKGKLLSADSINECISEFMKIIELMERASNYAHLDLTTDNGDPAKLDRAGKASIVMGQVHGKLSFIKTELIYSDANLIEEAISKKPEHSNFLSDVLREKPHTLSAETEEALAYLGPVFDNPYKIYMSAASVDMDFGTFKANDTEYPLSFGIFEGESEYEPDTEKRRAAYEKFYEVLGEYENTVASAYDACVQQEKVLSKLKKFDNVFDYLLFDQKVSREMYDRQIDTIMEKLSSHMRKYAYLIKKVHGLDKMTYADLKLPVDTEFAPDLTLDEAKDYLLYALDVMGDEYLAIINEGLTNRWVDYTTNSGKSSGAFCATIYDANSYILMSWAGKFPDLFTLAHEFGHAAHFTLAGRAQNIFDINVSTYVVEAPSTINELLLSNYLIKTTEDKRMKRWVLSSLVSNTYYHNFVTHLLEADYQRKVYKIVDEGGTLSASLLNKLKLETLRAFWGHSVEIPDWAGRTWMRQPHYYMGLYSYTYSAGLTIATQVSRRILAGDETAVSDWKEFLLAGGTKTPLELSKLAGSDMSTAAPLESTIDYIGSLIDEIIELS